MTTNRSPFLLPTVVFLGSVLHAAVFAGEEFHSSSYGYNLDVPPGWVEIPRDLVQERYADVLKPDSTVLYDAGFQLASFDQWFEFPFVLVQVIPLPRQINEDEFESYVQMLTGLDIDKLADEGISTDARQSLDNFEVGRLQLDAARRRYFYTMNMNVQGVGPVRVFSVGYFGRDSMVMIHFNSLRPDWDRYADVRREIVESFHFDPDKGYSVELAAANPTPPPIWQRVLKMTLIGLIVGALYGVIAAGIGALKRKKPGATQDALEEDVR